MVTPAQNVSYLTAYFQDGLRPPPRMGLAEWSDKYRILTSESSSEPGPWRTSRTPYLREIMDLLSPSNPCEKVVFMKGSQVGGTEVGINWLLFIMAHTPGPTLSVQPTIEVSKRYSKQRLTPAIVNCEILEGIVHENKSRDSSNTMLQKDFPGGTLILGGANSAPGLRSMPIKHLFADEVDAYPPDVGGEGDPLSLAEKRLSTFSQKKELVVSTPTIKDMSRIEKEFLGSDQRYYFVPCPLCSHFQIIKWKQIKFDGVDLVDSPKTARLICEDCAREIQEHHKTEMLENGEWRKQNPRSETPGFHLSALYSPLGWYSWPDAVKEHLDAIGDPLKRKVWVNTMLGELWDDASATIDHHWLLRRREKYEHEVPQGVLVLTAGVDTQDDRLEISVYGWGFQFQSWLISDKTFLGNTSKLDVWADLDKYLNTEFEHASGQKMMIACTCIDAMGHRTDEVYDFVRPRFDRRVFAIQGRPGPGHALVYQTAKSKKHKIYLLKVGVDAGKGTLYQRLGIKDPGPGYMHFPENTTPDFFKQLTAEKRILKNNAGIPKLQWILPGGKRNEALDKAIYAMAAMDILKPNLALLHKENLVYVGKPRRPQVKRKRVFSKGVS